MYDRAISGVLCKNMLLYFAYCDFEETRVKYEKVHSVYQKLLEVEDVDPTLVGYPSVWFAKTIILSVLNTVTRPIVFFFIKTLTILRPFEDDKRKVPYQIHLEHFFSSLIVDCFFMLNVSLIESSHRQIKSVPVNGKALSSKSFTLHNLWHFTSFGYCTTKQNIC